MGKPFMPWQRDLYDVALEVDPATGRLAYNEVGVTVPRQSGKTTPDIARKIWRAECSQHLGGRQRMLYAAQTRNDAREKWEDEFLEELKACRAMRGRFTYKLTNGRERIVFRDGSTYGPISTTPTAGHGKVLDDGTLDEAFAQIDDRVEAAWEPAMSTRPSPQLWVVSTAGTAESVYLKGKVDSGRAAAEADTGFGVCYTEYSAPEDADPGDPDVWALCMPALGFTQSLERMHLRYEKYVREGKLPEFLRAYLNLWTERVVDSVIPIRTWRALKDETSAIATGLVLAFDVAPDRSSAAIAAAGLRADGLRHLEVIDHRAGTGWVIPRMVELVARHEPAGVALDRNSPAAALLPELARQLPYLEPRQMSTGNMAQACGALLDGAKDGTFRHLGDPLLEQALAGADRRIINDAWAWKRRTSTCDISPLVAVTAAAWCLSITEPFDAGLLSFG